MSILLNNPLLWPFIFLAAIPLLIHLFARSKPPVYHFSSVEFILRIIRSTLRIKRPQDWLILAVRTLLFSAIIFLFLLPILFLNRNLAGPFQRKNVVLVVDATASMSYMEGAQTRFATACAEASEMLSGLSSGDRANIIWLKSTPEPVFPELGANLGYLQDALRRARVTSEAGNVDEALKLGFRMLEGKEGKREICLVSDFQKTTWKNSRAEMPSGIGLVKMKTGTGDAMNAAVTDIRVVPPTPLAGEEVAIYCDVYNYSPNPARKTVFMGVGESRQSRDMVIPAWNRASAIFKHKFASAGQYALTVSCGEDSFSGDDRRWAILTVREFLRIGILAQEPATGAAWRRALNAVGWARTQSLSPKDLSGALPLDVLMVSGWDESFRDCLRKKLEDGCTVVWFPAKTVNATEIPAITGGTVQNCGETLRWEESETFHRLKVVGEQDEMFRIFAGGEHGDLSRATFRARLVFSASAVPRGDVLLTYDDAVPALIRYTRTGRFLLWNMPLDPKLSNWANRVEFLPFLAEMLLTSRTMAGERGEESASFLAGEDVALKLDHDVVISDLSFKRENGESLLLHESRGAGASVVVAEKPEIGLYTWEYQEKPLKRVAVNFPVVESDLRVMSPNEIEKPGTTVVSGGGRARLLRDGIQLWPYLLMLSVVVALAEGCLLMWVERK